MALKNLDTYLACDRNNPVHNQQGINLDKFFKSNPTPRLTRSLDSYFPKISGVGQEEHRDAMINSPVQLPELTASNADTTKVSASTNADTAKASTSTNSNNGPSNTDRSPTNRKRNNLNTAIVDPKQHAVSDSNIGKISAIGSVNGGQVFGYVTTKSKYNVQHSVFNFDLADATGIVNVKSQGQPMQFYDRIKVIMNIFHPIFQPNKFV